MIQIERARKVDIPEIKQVLSTTWVDTYGKFLSPQAIQEVTAIWHDPKLLADQADDPEIYFGIAKDEAGKVIGLVTVQKVDEQTLMMHRLYVYPDNQRKGIGTRLMESALEAFPSTKIVRLQVEEQNQKGLAFYLKSGFKEVEKKRERVGDVVMDVVVMEREV